MSNEQQEQAMPEQGATVLGLQRQDVLVLLIAVAVLVAMLWLMNRILFPEGTGLGERQTAGVESSWSEEARDREFSIAGTENIDAQVVARLDRTHRTVKLRKADGVAWSGVDVGQELHHRDAVQTLARSRAVIAFSENSTVRLGERSLVVIQSAGQDVFRPRSRPSLTLRDGEISGTHLAGSASLVGGSLADSLEIELPTGRLRLFGADAADFRIERNPDETSTVEILSGRAQLRAAGQVVDLDANQGVTFADDDDELIVRDLPTKPVALGPGRTSVLRYGDVPPPVRFAWRASDDDVDHRFVLARDADFEQVVLDTRLSAAHFDYDNLLEGDYYWRVSGVRGWQEGPPTAARKLSLERDRLPPSIVLIEDTLDSDGLLRLRGRTEPGAQVLVAGETVATGAGGGFEHQIALQAGANVVVVEAIDSVGNMAFQSLVVHNPANTKGELQ